MKTVKTANGIKKIEDWNSNLVPIQLRSILQEHRATLVDKLLNGGLPAYVDYKFAMKIEPKQMDVLKDKLTSLKNDGIDMELYASIFTTVQKNEFTAIGNALFYTEIDSAIKTALFQPQLFTGRRQMLFQ